MRVLCLCLPAKHSRVQVYKPAKFGTKENRIQEYKPETSVNDLKTNDGNKGEAEPIFIKHGSQHLLVYVLEDKEGKKNQLLALKIEDNGPEAKIGTLSAYGQFSFPHNNRVRCFKTVCRRTRFNCLSACLPLARVHARRARTHAHTRRQAHAVGCLQSLSLNRIPLSFRLACTNVHMCCYLQLLDAVGACGHIRAAPVAHLGV